VLCLSGEALTLNIPCTLLGWEVHQMVVEKLQPAPGTRLVLHGTSELKMKQSLKEQGMEKEATLSCTFCRTNLYVAWSCAKSGNNEDDFGLEGVTELQGLSNVKAWCLKV
jgi:hypothetical protein